MKQNKAWVYSPQAPSLIEEVPFPTPQPASNEVVVENAAIGINPVDWKFVKANPLNWPTGHVPGVDGAGTVVAVGGSVHKSLIGCRVAYHAALKHNGSFARATVVDASRVMKLPNTISFEQAAALPCPMLTAWMAFEKLPLNSKPCVLLVGFGAVNKVLAQLLLMAGCPVDVVSKSLSTEQAKHLGIGQVFDDITSIDTTYAMIIDAVGSDSATAVVPKLKANGHIVCIQGRVPQPVDPAFTRTISYHEVALGALHDYGDEQDWHHLMQSGQALFDKVVVGEILLSEVRCFEFGKMREALAHSELRKIKTVVIVD